MLIDPTWVDGPGRMLMLLPSIRRSDDAECRVAEITETTHGAFARIWSAADGDANCIDAADLPTTDEANAWCVQRLRELGHAFAGDPTVQELAERIAVLESLVYAMQMRGGHEA